MLKPNDGRIRVTVENIAPEVNCGRFPIKRIAGDTVVVEADVFGEGHDEVRARLLWKKEGESAWQTTDMLPLGNDRWRAGFPVEEVGRYRYTVAGEVDRIGTWRSDLKKRIAAQQNLKLPLEVGALLLEQVQPRTNAEDSAKLAHWADVLRAGDGGSSAEGNIDEGANEGANDGANADALVVALGDELAATVRRYPETDFETWYERELEVIVDRERARFSSWYELFPRSWSATPGKHGTLGDVTARLGYVAEMGFDVLYLSPIHPIGKSFRKGRNNAAEAMPGDVGSPWAIGSAEGGHCAIHPELGTMTDLVRLVERADQLGMEVALDIAFQASPDHPWVREHPEFFKKRPDGSIQYAENPPKKYQDIYPLDFETSSWEALWKELKGVFTFWIGKGVRIFRVDNPHTKAFPFWDWVIPAIKAEHPDVLFLAEAFTRPRVMERLAKAGFSQSYTYFTWRTTKQELTEYMRELTATSIKEYFRPNFWPNTPDILPEGLQAGGRPAFISQLVLAGTLAANYGIYGPAFELGENIAVRPASEDYLNSEKYEIRRWDLDVVTSLKPLIARLNRARNENAALQSNERLHFHSIPNDSLICYSKRSADGENTILIVVNLDPFHVQAGMVDLDLAALGLEAGEPFEVEDLLHEHTPEENTRGEHTYQWRGASNYVELRPSDIPAHLFRVRKRIRTK